jgi:hypothetical protein
VAREGKLLQTNGRVPDRFAVGVDHARLIENLLGIRPAILVNTDRWVLVRLHIDDEPFLYGYDAFDLVVSVT